ncbi:hypothetical protein J4207_01930 [Candidatus Woesearchaeota archaeon]|nr:hypothetical protein [Candidatus Woesearchaeota archaeon]
MRNKDEILWKLEGLHTIETAMKTLSMKRQSTLNLLSKLKKEQNKYSPHMKLAEWYDHQVHGVYGPEEALIDAIETQSFRVILASLHLFRHIKDWKKLYKLANERDCWNKVGALYDVARLVLDKIQQKVLRPIKAGKVYLIKNYPTKEDFIRPIERKWNVAISFRRGDFDWGIHS